MSFLTKRTPVIIILGLLYLVGSGCGGNDAHDEHAGHDHGAAGHGEKADGYAGHDGAAGGHEEHDEDGDGHGGHEDAEDGHAEHARGKAVTADAHAGHDHGTGEAEAGKLVLTARAVGFAGITVARAEQRTIEKTVLLPAEIGYDQERMAHVTPRFGGIIKQVNVQTGASVQEGEVLAVIEARESFALFEVRSPLTGRIIEKHAVAGESAGDGEPLFMVADLGRVWVNCPLYPQDLGLVAVGSRAVITSPGNGRKAEGSVSFISPVFDRETRTASARIVIGSGGGAWRPGMFVQVEVRTRGTGKVTAVKADAVQVLEGESVVFVPAGELAFQAVPVVAEPGNGAYRRIVSGLHPGDEYVATGAFELKSRVVTSSLDPHAGHGH